jgi:VWFA-related protein
MVQGISAQPQSTPPASDQTEPAATLQTFSRMVTLEVVVKDSKGNHIKGLKAGDFKVFEQAASRSKEKHEQKIASFREVNIADLAKQNADPVQPRPGVYSNAVTLAKDPAPPTILLVDGLNTDVQYQAQVHVQMLQMLRQLPPDIPVAVFLLGNRLVMLQSFTTDPSLLQEALRKAMSTKGKGEAGVDPRDDANSTGNELAASAHVPAEMVAAARALDQSVYAGSMDMRVNRTIDALESIARNLAGYPGRKNLLWLSTAFPIVLNPQGASYQGYRNYWDRLQDLKRALSDAKISVYPINVAGVQAPDFFTAGATPAGTSGRRVASTVGREITMQTSQQDTTQEIAEGTGGQVCTGDNDLADCVRKAVDDSSDYYELAYYPDSPDWNGEYRKVIISAEHRGAQLAYREGYFALAEGSGNPSNRANALQSACEDVLNATAVAFRASSLPPDSPEQLKFSLSIDASALTLAPTSDGGREADLSVAVCTFDANGSPLKLMSYPVAIKLDAKKYGALAATRSLSGSIFVPGPKPAAVRLLVMDVASGGLGSIYIKTDDLGAASLTKPSRAGGAQPSQ